MNTERHQRIFEIFKEAVTLTGGERRRFLDTACPDDRELRTHVDGLLAADRSGFAAFDEADGET